MDSLLVMDKTACSAYNYRHLSGELAPQFFAGIGPVYMRAHAVQIFFDSLCALVFVGAGHGSKAYRLAQNPMAQPTVVQAQPVQPQAPHQN